MSLEETIASLLEQTDIFVESGEMVCDIQTKDAQLYEQITSIGDFNSFLVLYVHWKSSRSPEVRKRLVKDHISQSKVQNSSADLSADSKSGLPEKNKDSVPIKKNKDSNNVFYSSNNTSVSSGKTNRVRPVSKNGLPKDQNSGLLPVKSSDKQEVKRQILVAVLGLGGTSYQPALKTRLDRIVDIPPTTYKRYVRELAKENKIRMSKQDGMNLLELTPYGKKFVLDERRKTLSGGWDEPNEVTETTIGFRAHNLSFKIPFKVASLVHLDSIVRNDLVGNGGHLVPSRMKHWTKYTNSTEYEGVTYAINSSSVSVYIREVYTTDPYDAILKGYEIVEDVVLELSKRYKGMLFQNIAKVKQAFSKTYDIIMSSQHYAMPNDEIAKMFIDSGIKISENKSNGFLVIDTSKSPELEFVDKKFAPEDAKTYVQQVYDMVRNAPSFRASDVVRDLEELRKFRNFQMDVVNPVTEMRLDEQRHDLDAMSINVQGMGKTLQRVDKRVVGIAHSVESLPTSMDIHQIMASVHNVEGMATNMAYNDMQVFAPTLNTIMDNQRALSMLTQQMLAVATQERHERKQEKKEKKSSVVKRLLEKIR